MSSKPTPEHIDAVSRISGLVLINAMIFQEIIAEHDTRIRSLSKIADDPNPPEEFRQHWKYIIEKIDYDPIFRVARELLLDLTASKDIIDSLRKLARTALEIVGKRAALRHDLMGRVYHRLLADRKYLATYYTGIPAANLLLKLALKPDRWQTDWSDLQELQTFRIADLACGTGTLLMAAANTVTDNYVAASASTGREVDLAAVQTKLTEDILYGYDVLPSALHLTASTLAMKAPDVLFHNMHLWSLQLGGPSRRLGSLEFLASETVGVEHDLFGGQVAAQQIKGQGTTEAAATIPKLDLCVMNPPFTRSVGGNLLFGSSPPAERAAMQKELKSLVKKSGAFASITAGLGSVFVAIADKYIKPNGRLALVLPKAFLSGVAWDKTRQLLRGRYHVEYIVCSHDPDRWNFSESTALSEVLIVAKKLPNGTSDNPAPKTVGVNLRENPTINFDALAIANDLSKSSPPDIAQGQGALKVGVGKRKMGEAVSIPWTSLRDEFSWLLPCAFAQSDLIRVAYYLMQNRVWIPGRKELIPIALSPLGQLASLGPDRRDIHDGFEQSSAKTSYPSFWGHDSKVMTTMAQQPNCYLSPLPEAKKDRNLRKASDLWPLAGKVLVAERLWMKTQRLVSVRLTQPVLANVWWSLSFKEHRNVEANGKVLSLWMNSTLGMLLLLACREETRGAWVDFKKPVLAKLPVLDFRLLTSSQLRELASAYDALSRETLQPFPMMAEDPVRAKIDEAICKVLDLPDLSVLRTLLAQEPIVCLKRL